MDIVYPERYYDKMKEKFPELSDTQIDKIVTYGVRSLFMMTKYGADIKVQQGRFFAYFGQIIQNSEFYVKYRTLKLTIKTRLLYSQKKKPYNGKYYFILPEEKYKELKNKKKGKSLPFDQVCICKIQKEAELGKGSYLYEIDYPEDIGYKKKIPAQNINYRLIAKRDPNNVWGPFIPIATEDKKEKTIKRSPKKRK